MKAFLALMAAAAAGAGLVIYAGWYDISADQHLAPTFHVLDFALRRAVRQHARDIAAPDLDDLAKRQRGVAPEPFALGMTPAPAALAHTAREWTPAELYWVVKRGIKMTGMPAWEYRMSEDDLWALVAFMRELPLLSPAQYRALQAPSHERLEHAQEAKEPDAKRGREAIGHYACVTCHRIPGGVGDNAPVGAPLERIGSRNYIAGILPSTPDNMARWLRNPQAIDANSAMPDLGVSERDARDIAAYLYTLR